MKDFLLKLFVFTSILIILLVAITSANKYGISKAMSSDALQFDKSITTLIAGDSHLKTSLDPALVAKSVNICEHRENYVYTYAKLQHFLAINPQIKNIVLGFSYHNISKLFPESTLKDISWNDSYYLLLDEEEKKLLDPTNISIKLAKLKYDLGIPIEIYKVPLGFKAFLGRHMKPEDYPFFGGFYKSQECNINNKDLAITIKRHYFDEANIYAGTSKVNIEYLNKIVEMCTNKHINLFLFMAPLNKRYLDRIPPESVINYNNVKNDLLRKYSSLNYIDLSRLQLKDEWMGDCDHVNSLGARLVSIEVQKRMNLCVLFR